MIERLKATVRVILPELFTLLIIGGSIYFFYERNFAVGVVAFIWAMTRIFEIKSNLKKEEDIPRDVEREVNVLLDFGIQVKEVLNHPSLNQLFEKLKAKEIINAVNKDDWMEELLENYKKKFKREDTWERVSFNIKSNLLWKNGEIDFRNYVYHEFTIE